MTAELPDARRAPQTPAAAAASNRGLLLFAHGARDPMWARPFETVAGVCRAARGESRVALAFLEFIAPDLAAAGATLAEAGCTEVDVVPLFLGAGGHVRKDVPALMARLEQTYPQVRWRLKGAIGQEPAVIAAMAQVALAAAASDEQVPVR